MKGRAGDEVSLSRCNCFLPARIGPVACCRGTGIFGGAVKGLWAYETKFPVGLAGELTVKRRDGSWQGHRRRHRAGPGERKRSSDRVSG